MNSFLKNNIITITLSKLAGFIRQIFIAAAFGIGITYDAYNYAYIIPGFILIIIGGINGPLHNAIVAVLTPLNSKKAGLILSRISIKLTFILFLLGLIIFLKATFIIGILGPNLTKETQLIAATQLKILSPCIPLSGFIGLSFGALNSKNKFFISSISPSIISLATITFILVNWSIKEEVDLFGSNLLALSTLTGTFIQFIIQVFEVYKIGLLRIKKIWGSILNEEKRVFRLIIPASLSSGLGQINVFIDMFFASSFQGAASGLAYGNFLIQAPLGILSNALILPILPKFSKLRSSNNTKEFQKTLISGIESCFLITFFLTGLFITFNSQMVEFIFQRGAFNYQASNLVEKILIAYAIGIPFSLYRDLLIRTYYSIEKTKLPFKLSIAAILFNFIFDWFLVGAPTGQFGNLVPINFGVVGLVISSGLVNLLSCIILSIKLSNNGIFLPNNLVFRKTFLIFLSCLLTITIYRLFFLENLIIDNSNNLIKLSTLILGCSIYTIVYFLITKLFKVNSIKLIY